MDSKNNKNNKNSKNNRNLRGVLVLLAWAVVLTIGFNYFAAYTGNAANKATSFEVDFSALADLVREDKIARVEFKNGQILATQIDGYVYTDESGKEPKTYTNSEKTKVTLYTTQINSNNFYDLLDEHHVAYTAPVVEQMSPILQFMISYILPTILAGRGQGIPGGDHRLPPQPRQVHRHRRQAPQGRAAGGLPRYGQNPAGQGCGRGGQCAVFLHLRLRLCGDVRGCGRQPRA